MTNHSTISTLSHLKAAGYKSVSIKEELRNNLVANIKSGVNVFEGIHGYANSVIPELERAILSKHNINLLGLRGQAKTRLARMMVNLLDEYMPIVAGSEVNDDPLAPLSRFAIDLIAEKGEETPIAWVHRNERFAEKLATPDVTIADIIGDVDPIKAANLKLSYADERVIHFGMIPRANRCIFVINELPDLQARIQVALFNILQEGDIQIRGFKLRFPLDMQFVFTANPEDYTNRGSIVTPLKDRIGSQILTHYPESIQIARTITEQEAKLDQRQKDSIYVPSLAMDIIEQIGFEARDSEYIDYKSGVSARMSITAFENLMSTAELRNLKSGTEKTAIRVSDFSGIVPALTGKMELVYEGEQEGSRFVADKLISSAIKTLFESYFPKVEKLEKADARGPYQDIVEWFFDADEFQINDDDNDESYASKLNSISPLDKLVQEYQPNVAKEDTQFLKEFILWGLVESKKLSKNRFEESTSFTDPYGNYMKNMQ
jgi:magnesium chelatase subunit I